MEWSHDLVNFSPGGAARRGLFSGFRKCCIYFEMKAAIIGKIMTACG